MKLKNVIFISFIILTASCKDDDVFLNIDGDYFGTFQREDNVAKIEIEFANGTFMGHSSGEGYLIPVYHGEYSIDNNTIIFYNKQLVLPTIYDPSTLLNGKWNFAFDGNFLNMTKSNGDLYTLEKR